MALQDEASHYTTPALKRLGTTIFRLTIGPPRPDLSRCRSLLGAFARGLQKDCDAEAAALTEPWSNGQTEGQINRLKMLKRQMYGRAGVGTLAARMTAMS